MAGNSTHHHSNSPVRRKILGLAEQPLVTWGGVFSSHSISDVFCGNPSNGCYIP